VLTKFDVNNPVNAARWPGCNEISVSLNGSPLIVPTSSQISMINLNIPLSNGRVSTVPMIYTIGGLLILLLIFIL
jgi:hypothetical protein